MGFPKLSPAVTVAVAFALLLTGCESGPAPTAMVAGTVRNTAGTAIGGALVQSGSERATTDADGHFELQNLPVGPVTITASAPRFEEKSEELELAEGSNSWDAALADKTIYAHNDFRAYLPLAVEDPYRAAIVFLPGLRDPATGKPLDSRSLVGGTSTGVCSIWCSSTVADVRQRARALLGGKVALIGTLTLEDNPGSYSKLVAALQALATESLHPELSTIPILFVGHSMGGCTAYGFSRARGDRVAGFVTMKGGCHNPGPAEDALEVPGYFLIGGADEDYRRENITGVFEAGRAAGAPWAISIDGLGHNPMDDLDQMFAWIDAVLTARLPENVGEPLRPMTETAGWLGDRSSGAISTWECYGASPSAASWLPTQETALQWQEMAAGSGVVTDC